MLETLRDGTHAVKQRLTRIGDSFFRIYPAGSKSVDTGGPWYLDVAVLCEGRFTLIQTHTHSDTHTFRHTHMQAHTHAGAHTCLQKLRVCAPASIVEAPSPCCVLA